MLFRSAHFLKYITPFGYAEGTDIVTELSLDKRMVAVGMIFTVIGVAVGYFQYCKKDII